MQVIELIDVSVLNRPDRKAPVQRMDRKSRKILIERICAKESGADGSESFGQGTPPVKKLEPYLELWNRLECMPKAQPSSQGLEEGRRRLLRALSDQSWEKHRRCSPRLSAVARLAALVAGAALLGAGALGVSPALGGPNPAGEVLSWMSLRNAETDAVTADAPQETGDAADGANQGPGSSPVDGSPEDNQPVNMIPQRGGSPQPHMASTIGQPDPMEHRDKSRAAALTSTAEKIWRPDESANGHPGGSPVDERPRVKPAPNGKAPSTPDTTQHSDRSLVTDWPAAGTSLLERPREKARTERHKAWKPRLQFARGSPPAA